jgi:hypothetical protein
MRGESVHGLSALIRISSKSGGSTVSKNRDISEAQVQRALWGFWNWSYPGGYTSGGTLPDTRPAQLLATPTCGSTDGPISRCENARGGGDAKGQRPCLQMMDEDEQRRWKELPEIVTIYRGCGAHNIHGVSWTLDRAVAGEFPTLNRYKVEDPVLVTAMVSKHGIVAVKLDRQEEVITFRSRIVKIEKLSRTKG